MDQFITLLWSALGIIVTGLISWCTSALIAWLNTKIKDKKMAEKATALINIVMDAVKAVFQSFVQTLKDNGKFNEAAQKEAKEKALAIINGQLTDELKKYIQDNFGDIQSYLETLIESVIYNLKK